MPATLDIVGSRLTKIQARKFVMNLSTERKARLIEDMKMSRLASEVANHSYSKDMYCYVMRLLGLTI